MIKYLKTHPLMLTIAFALLLVLIGYTVSEKREVEVIIPNWFIFRASD